MNHSINMLIKMDANEEKTNIDIGRTYAVDYRGTVQNIIIEQILRVVFGLRGTIAVEVLVREVEEERNQGGDDSQTQSNQKMKQGVSDSAKIDRRGIKPVR